uniref:Kinesin 14-IIa protein n=1 Tax=Marsilea vestita TaxID=59764 RepID=A0A142KWC7_MARVE|nr:kinesin 14-IIa protein [Marsilea vestita]
MVHEQTCRSSLIIRASSSCAATSQKLYCSSHFQASEEYNRTFRDYDANVAPDHQDVRTPLGRLTETSLASRRAIELARRRFQAAAWMQNMVGPLDLSLEPTEEEFRMCLMNGVVLCNLINKVHPGAVPQIVQHIPNSPDGAAFQCSENIKNFLLVVEEMKLPAFEVSDLEKGGLHIGWTAKLVDCILSIKAYYEWQQSGRQELWKLGSYKSSTSPHQPVPRPVVSCSWFGSGRSEVSISKSECRNFNDWSLDNVGSVSDEYCSFTEKSGMIWKGHSAHVMDSTLAWVQHVCRKYVDTFMARKRNSRHASVLGIPDTSMPCEALLKLVMAVLDDKSPEEVATLVEFMLKKVIEEYRQQSLCQERESGQLYLKSQTFNQEVNFSKNTNQDYAARLESQSNEIKDLKSALETTRLQFQKFQFGWEKEMEALQGKLQGLGQAAAQYHKVAAENRELYNLVQDLKGNIRVYCRVRPFLPGQRNVQSTVDYIGDRGTIAIQNPTKQGKDQRKSFTFNKVFGPSASQEEVFLDTQPLIRSVLDGYNVCIFAYGQTGSGKTHTMMGPNNPCPDDWGVNFRALNDLFYISHERQDVVRYEVAVQMMEIYNEQVRDLLCSDGTNKKLEIRNNSQQNGLNVPDASLHPVNSTEAVLDLMALGHKNRAVGSTALNERSSRSHSVLTVHVKGTDLTSGDALRGCLHLVDLAGSERVDKSEAIGERLKEAQHINRSLSALGDVIAALAQKSSHVPYRNSKLTQLLQDALGGQAKTLMFVHVSPDQDSYGETISTLKFAERVAKVELGAAQSNKESGEIRELRDQVAYLRDALARKEAELELCQREHRVKGNDKFHEKAVNDMLAVSSTFSYGLDDDSIRWQSHHITSPDSRSSSTTTSEVSFPINSAVGNSGPRNSKARQGSFDYDDFDQLIPHPSLERTRSISAQNNGSESDRKRQMKGR